MDAYSRAVDAGMQMNTGHDTTAETTARCEWAYFELSQGDAPLFIVFPQVRSMTQNAMHALLKEDHNESGH